LPTRRQFIKVGLAGAALFAAARYLDQPSAARTGDYRVLDEDAAKIMRALIPVVLAGSLSADETERARTVVDVLAAFDRAVSGLAPAGLWAPVDETPREELKAFLTRWRHSRFDLQRQGYEALTQLVQASWYDNPASWKAIGYPGPPAVTEKP